MPSQLNAPLETRPELAEPVRRADRVLMPMLLEHSQNAKALWDLGQDERGREVLTLVLTDPWGYAAGDFAPDELANETLLQKRFYRLIGDMIMPRHPQEHRARIELRDAFVTADQLEQFRLRLANIPDIQQARLRLHNQNLVNKSIVREIKNYLRALGQSDPRDFCLPIREFLDSFQLSTGMTEWPSSGD